LLRGDLKGKGNGSVKKKKTRRQLPTLEKKVSGKTGGRITIEKKVIEKKRKKIPRGATLGQKTRLRKTVRKKVRRFQGNKEKKEREGGGGPTSKNGML